VWIVEVIYVLLRSFMPLKPFNGFNGAQIYTKKLSKSSPFVVEAEEVGENFLVYFGAFGGAGVIRRQGLTGAGGGVEGGPVFLPVALGVDGGVGGEDGLVEFFVGELEPGGALVVEVGEGAFFEVGGGGGLCHEGGVADEGAGFGG
jgi:hypothetical protein